MKKVVIPYSEKLSLWSEKQKKAMGFDFPSFMRRMQKRLDKVRGKEDTSEDFWARHNYQKTYQPN